ncbi:hypothetical protein [Amycolatopsis orientalis]|uniref:hypothetical protein n=1 Tax=Amycolatopsis orientalis TaxID=31958 RepID=UPI0004141589|nr:hypothetical protein [Amycolatopsis orientalis]
MGFLKSSAKTLDKTADFLAKDRKKRVDPGTVSPKVCYGGCGSKGKKLYAGYGHCGAGICRQIITSRILNG